MPFSSGRKNIVCLSSLNWTSCLISRRSTNLERRVVFSRENILLFVLFIVARRIWNVVSFSSGRKLTLFALTARLDIVLFNFQLLDEFDKFCCFYRDKNSCIVLLSSPDEFGPSCLIFSRRHTSLERLEVNTCI